MERRQARRGAVGIIAAGWAAALVVYFTAKPVNEYPLGYDPLTDKKYVLELQRFGGKANVFSAELLQWWDRLWHGKTLAFTIAALAVLCAGCFWVAATLPPIEEAAGDRPHGPGDRKSQRAK
jgi:hypothetical protein